MSIKRVFKNFWYHVAFFFEKNLWKTTQLQILSHFGFGIVKVPWTVLGGYERNTKVVVQLKQNYPTLFFYKKKRTTCGYSNLKLKRRLQKKERERYLYFYLLIPWVQAVAPIDHRSPSGPKRDSLARVHWAARQAILKTSAILRNCLLLVKMSGLIQLCIRQYFQKVNCSSLKSASFYKILCKKLFVSRMPAIKMCS